MLASAASALVLSAAALASFTAWICWFARVNAAVSASSSTIVANHVACASMKVVDGSTGSSGDAVFALSLAFAASKNASTSPQMRSEAPEATYPCTQQAFHISQSFETVVHASQTRKAEVEAREGLGLEP